MHAHAHARAANPLLGRGGKSQGAVVSVPRCRVTRPEWPAQQVPARQMARVLCLGHDHAQSRGQQLPAQIYSPLQGLNWAKVYEVGTAGSGVGSPPLDSQVVVTPCRAMESVRRAEPASGTASVPDTACGASQLQRTEDQGRGEGRTRWAEEGCRRLQAGPLLAQGRAFGVALRRIIPQCPAAPSAVGSRDPDHGLVCPQPCRQRDPCQARQLPVKLSC